jgi:hypothetical protein
MDMLSMDIRLAGCVPFYRLQYGRAGCTPFINARMSDCPVSSQYKTGIIKNADMSQFSTGIKGSSPVQMAKYRTEIKDAGMLMPVTNISL